MQSVSLAGLIYLTYLLDRIDDLVHTVLIASGCLIEEGDAAQRKFTAKIIKICAVIMIICAILLVIVPDEATMKAIKAASLSA